MSGREPHRAPSRRRPAGPLSVRPPAFIRRFISAPKTRWGEFRLLALRYAGIAGSLTFHATVLILALATYTVGKQIIGRHRETMIVPDETIIDGARPGGVPNPGIASDAMRPPAAVDGPQEPGEVWAAKHSKALESALMDDAPDAARSVIGVGNHALLGQGITGAGSDTAAAPFGMPGGGESMAPKSTFMGSSGNATRILYVCDCSGSMMGGPLDSVRQELEKSVNRLVPIQGFNVIFFSSGKPQMLANDLVPANALSKEKLKTFLAGIEIRKSSDPRRSLQMAFVEKPDLIYLLTDGDFNTDEYGEGPQSNAEVVRLIRWLNRDRHVHVNTIAFSSADPGSAEAHGEYVQTLKTIADQSGGTFRFVSSGQMR